jgi:hypothetical protein
MGDGCEGAVAQLGERRPCKAEVVGSSPISSTNRRGAGAPGRRGAGARRRGGRAMRTGWGRGKGRGIETARGRSIDRLISMGSFET